MPIEKDWRHIVYRHFSWPSSRLVIAYDPDGLLRDEGVTQHLTRLGFQQESFSKTPAFLRKWKEEWVPALEKGSLRLVINTADTRFEALPNEIRRHPLSDRYSFTLGDVFPKLTLNVLAQLDIADIDRVYAIQDDYEGVDDHRQTCAFLLDRIYKLNWRVCKSEVDLLRIMLPIHYRRQTLPQVIVDFLLTQWSEVDSLASLPLQNLFHNPAVFYGFLQRRWDAFLRDTIADTDNAWESAFHDTDVLAFLDNLFTEGLLTRYTVSEEAPLPPWVEVGVHRPSVDKIAKQVERLYEKLQAIDYVELNWRGWISAAMDLGALLEASIRLSAEPAMGRAAIDTLHDRIDEQFASWLSQHYDGLCTLPYLPVPVMGHHVLPWITSQKTTKNVLLVLDGMSFVQWPQIIERLRASGLGLDVYGLFSWIPTLTEISRRALFSGTMPRNSFRGLNPITTEERQFKDYYISCGLREAQIQYERGIINNAAVLDQIPRGSHILACGIIVNFIDTIVHDAQLGLPGVWSQVKLWLDGNLLLSLIDRLVRQDFDVILTSDHGHRNSIGIGTINDGVLAEIKGERVRIFQDTGLREKYHQKHESQLWDAVGLPSDMHCLLATGSSAFIREEDTAITHGAMSLMETVVPFAKIYRKGSETV